MCCIFGFVLVEPQIYPSRLARVFCPPLWHLQISFLIELHVLLLHKSYSSFLDLQRSFCSISVFSSFINHLKYRPLSPSFPNFTIFHQYFLTVLICPKSFASRSLVCSCNSVGSVFLTFLAIKVLIKSASILLFFSASTKHSQLSSPLLFPVDLPHTSLPRSIPDSYIPTCDQMLSLVLIVSPLPCYRSLLFISPFYEFPSY